MSDSKKLPTIEVGDTVVFRTDLENFNRYGSYLFVPDMARYTAMRQIVRQSHSEAFFIENDDLWTYSPEMVKEVIKPTTTKEALLNILENRVGGKVAHVHLEQPKPSKARVYSESDMIEFADKYAEYSYRESMNNRFKSPMSANDYFNQIYNSLNTEGK